MFLDAETSAGCMPTQGEPPPTWASLGRRFLPAYFGGSHVPFYTNMEKALIGWALANRGQFVTGPPRFLAKVVMPLDVAFAHVVERKDILIFDERKGIGFTRELSAANYPGIIEWSITDYEGHELELQKRGHRLINYTPPGSQPTDNALGEYISGLQFLPSPWACRLESECL